MNCENKETKKEGNKAVRLRRKSKPKIRFFFAESNKFKNQLRKWVNKITINVIKSTIKN